MGAVGLDWRIEGFGDFSSRPGETDMLMRNVNSGGLMLYDIANNQITGTTFLGPVGLDWQFAGVAPIQAPGASDLVLRNASTTRLLKRVPIKSNLSLPSCPRLARASTSFVPQRKTWMAGTSPAMTPVALRGAFSRASNLPRPGLVTANFPVTTFCA
jgi:hypothetical protein